MTPGQAFRRKRQTVLGVATLHGLPVRLLADVLDLSPGHAARLAKAAREKMAASPAGARGAAAFGPPGAQRGRAEG